MHAKPDQNKYVSSKLHDMNVNALALIIGTQGQVCVCQYSNHAETVF